MKPSDIFEGPDSTLAKRFKERSIKTVCFDCGARFGNGKKTVMGAWMDTCDICGESKACADAKHDFGIGISDEEFERSNSL